MQPKLIAAGLPSDGCRDCYYSLHSRLESGGCRAPPVPCLLRLLYHDALAGYPFDQLRQGLGRRRPRLAHRLLGDILARLSSRSHSSGWASKKGPAIGSSRESTWEPSGCAYPCDSVLCSSRSEGYDSPPVRTRLVSSNRLRRLNHHLEA